MGLIFSRFRKKLSSKDQLEKIQKDVAAIEEYGQHTQQRQKRLVGCLVLYSIVLYLVAAIVCYFYYFPTDLNHQLLYATPFIIFPLLIYSIKRLLTWYYHRKITNNEHKLKELKKRKDKILEDVMETETYKIAKELLEKYGNDSYTRTQMHKGSVATGQRLPSPTATPVQHPDVRRRILGTPQTGAGGGGVGVHRQLPHQTPAYTPRPPITALQTPATSRPPISMKSGGPTPGPMVSSSAQITTTSAVTTAATPLPPLLTPHPRAGGPPGPPMPRPVLPRERGILDRFVEYLVGDGPANRFALVCRQCESHNGMALKDEFPYLAFRCAYCFYWNPAKKQRPAAPRLETLAPPPLPPPQDQDDEDEEEGSSSGEEEEEEGEEESETNNSSVEEEEEEEEEEVDEEEEEEEEDEESGVLSSEISSGGQTTSSQEGSMEDLAKSTQSSDLPTTTSPSSDQTTASDQTDHTASSEPTSDEKKGTEALTTSSSTTPSSATENEAE